MCDCFTCTHKNMRERAAYYQGYVDACDWFLRWAATNKIPEGSIGDDDLSGLHAQIRLNRDESEYLRQEVTKAFRDKHREAQKSWADRNREKINQQGRDYYAKNKETVRAKANERYRRKKDERNK